MENNKNFQMMVVTCALIKISANRIQPSQVY